MAITTSPDPLAALRPIHWPEPVSWWPIALGWWILLALLVLAALLLWRRLRGNYQLRSARHALKLLQKQPLGEHAFVAELNRTLKRIALQRFPRQDVAALSGEQWLAFLDATGGDGEFCTGVGRILALSPYQKEPATTDHKALLTLAQHWATRVYHKGRH